MLDRSTPLQVPGRVADRMTEMEARRLAAEVRSGSTRTRWLTGPIRSAVHAGIAFAARLRRAAPRPGPRLVSGLDQLERRLVH